eukprot:CFRG8591T1
MSNSSLQLVGQTMNLTDGTRSPSPVEKPNATTSTSAIATTSPEDLFQPMMFSNHSDELRGERGNGLVNSTTYSLVQNSGNMNANSKNRPGNAMSPRQRLHQTLSAGSLASVCSAGSITTQQHQQTQPMLFGDSYNNQQSGLSSVLTGAASSNNNLFKFNQDAHGTPRNIFDLSAQYDTTADMSFNVASSQLLHSTQNADSMRGLLSMESPVDYENTQAARTATNGALSMSLPMSTSTDSLGDFSFTQDEGLFDCGASTSTTQQGSPTINMNMNIAHSHSAIQKQTDDRASVDSGAIMIGDFFGNSISSSYTHTPSPSLSMSTGMGNGGYSNTANMNIVGPHSQLMASGSSPIIVPGFWDLASPMHAQSVESGSMNGAGASAGLSASAPVAASPTVFSTLVQQHSAKSSSAKAKKEAKTKAKGGRKSVFKADKSEDENTPSSSCTIDTTKRPIAIGSGPDKPNHSYATLITMAINDSEGRRLTLSGIYKWIEDNYEFYSNQSDSSWKNSIRHNLSLKRCFYKSPRQAEEPGKGAWWSIDDAMVDGGKDHVKRKRAATTSVSRANTNDPTGGSKNNVKVIEGISLGTSKGNKKRGLVSGKQTTSDASSAIFVAEPSITIASDGRKRKHHNPTLTSVSTSIPTSTKMHTNANRDAHMHTKTAWLQAQQQQHILTKRTSSYKKSALDDLKNKRGHSLRSCTQMSRSQPSPSLIYGYMSDERGPLSRQQPQTTNSLDRTYVGMNVGENPNKDSTNFSVSSSVAMTTGFTVSPQLLHSDENVSEQTDEYGNQAPSRMKKEPMSELATTTPNTEDSNDIIQMLDIMEESHSAAMHSAYVAMPTTDVDIDSIGLFNTTVVTPDNQSSCDGLCVAEEGLDGIDISSALNLNRKYGKSTSHDGEVASVAISVDGNVEDNLNTSVVECGGSSVSVSMDDADIDTGMDGDESYSHMSSPDDPNDVNVMMVSDDYSCGSATVYEKSGETVLLEACRDWLLEWENTNGPNHAGMSEIGLCKA